MLLVTGALLGGLVVARRLSPAVPLVAGLVFLAFAVAELVAPLELLRSAALGGGTLDGGPEQVVALGGAPLAAGLLLVAALVPAGRSRLGLRAGPGRDGPPAAYGPVPPRGQPSGYQPSGHQPSGTRPWVPEPARPPQPPG